jgi:hypothetical protein
MRPKPGFPHRNFSRTQEEGDKTNAIGQSDRSIAGFTILPDDSC